MKFMDALNRINGATPDHGNEEIGTAFEKLREGVELLEWLLEQDHLLWKTWHYMGGKQKTSVYLCEEDPSHLQGEGTSVLEALTQAKLASEE